MLCSEALVLSFSKIHQRRIGLAFNNHCPSCGFDLNDQLSCEEYRLSQETSVQTNPKCESPESLLDKRESYRPLLLRGSRLTRGLEVDCKTGIRQIDCLTSGRGQLAVLQGRTANQFVFRLAARAIASQGGNQNIVFIDGGNSFETKTLAQHFSSLGLKEQVEERVHVSRAFTYPQLAHLIREMLPNALTNHSAKLACVSDITLLFSDPDVKDRTEAMGVFRSSVGFLASLAEQTNSLIVVTNLESRDRKMDSILLKYGRLFATGHEGGFPRLIVKNSAFLSRPVSMREDSGSVRLSHYFQ